MSLVARKVIKLWTIALMMDRRIVLSKPTRKRSGRSSNRFKP